MNNNKSNQDDFFDDFELGDNKWEEEWVGMPEYNNVEQPDPFIEATFKFRNQEDFDFFNKFLRDNLYQGEKVFDGMQRKHIKSTWFPLKEKSKGYRIV